MHPETNDHASNDHAGSVSPRAAVLVARGVVVVFLAGWGGGAWLAALNGKRVSEDFTLMLAMGSFALVGALIVSRRPDNSVGWIFAAIGLFAAGGYLGMEYAHYGFITNPGSLPAVGVAAWIQSWFWFPVFALMGVFTLYAFPTGSLQSRRWRPPALLGAIATVVITVLASLNPTILLQGTSLHVRNPLGVSVVGNVEESAVGAVLGVALIVSMLCGLASVIVRFRRSRGDERQQLKWFMYAGALFACQVLIDEIAGPLPGDLLFGLIIAFLPISAGIAILKYRLYDIDVLINRTLVYGTLTILLVLVYLGGVLVVGTALRELFGRESNQAAVAASTLAVAALFGPVRARLQSIIDRRFYRRRYDATQTLEAFSGRLRQEVELDALTADLLATVRDSVHPAHLSLWLRTP